MSTKSQFRNPNAPLNYVAGLGRGATGFTTRSDIGPSRYAAPAEGEGAEGEAAAPAGYVAGRGRGASSFGGAAGGPDNEADNYSEDNYDEFAGYGGSLFDSSTPYEKDDEEADKIWVSVDERMDGRRKARREEKLKKEMEKYRAERPKIQQQFADLKETMKSVSFSEWEAIPEIGDRSLRHKAKQTRYTPVPDSLLERAQAENAKVAVLDSSVQGATPFGGDTPLGDLNQIGNARQQILNNQLSHMSESVQGQTVVDPKGYLTGLNSMRGPSGFSLGNVKEARLLLQSVTASNPKHAPGWQAAAQLEMLTGNLSAARKIIMRGCKECPESEDLWVNAAKMQTGDKAKLVMAQAAKANPTSVNIWLYRAHLEPEEAGKKAVLRDALDKVPGSVRLWKALVELEDPDNARILLGRAVECCPTSLELWLALARLETYENARRVLNTARTHFPLEPTVWVNAAKLEEANQETPEKAASAAEKIINRACQSLRKGNVAINRDQWFKEAEGAERSASVLTAGAIIQEVLPVDVDPQDRKRRWMEDAEAFISRGSIACARAVYAVMTRHFPKKKSVWLRAAFLERNHGTKDALFALLRTAVDKEHCPQAEILWLMWAKEAWLGQDVEAARKVLESAFENNRNNEQIWLAAVKLERKNGEVERARQLLLRAREQAGKHERVWVKSAKLERQCGALETAHALLTEGVRLFPKSAKLWLMQGLNEEDLAARGGPAGEAHARNAVQVYSKGLQQCPKSVPLWLAASRCKEKKGGDKARAVLERAVLQVPRSPEIWLERVRVEMRAGSHAAAVKHMANGLRECPTSGVLWAEAIRMEPREKQKSKCVDALKKTEDAVLVAAVAVVLWRDSKIAKAKSFFQRCVSLAPLYGDGWAFYHRFLARHAPEEVAGLEERCVRASPTQGEHWRGVRKDARSEMSVLEVLKATAKRVGSQCPE
eukprot:CAMPEP_0177675638 /NCGR_PEP_ID=MMETSP0447-20121125/27316_1 /TAXON_ID=0 /ORGANISM="Stygamoeba regulata, Strain BSH-02190019" /LENGTH=943 /DNA_ID=CAMNT_0019184055 /DNA_START=176 /DNA_END=3007 /DNA_ORIENTATION=-